MRGTLFLAISLLGLITAGQAATTLIPFNLGLPKNCTLEGLDVLVANIKDFATAHQVIVTCPPNLENNTVTITFSYPLPANFDPNLLGFNIFGSLGPVNSTKEVTFNIGQDGRTPATAASSENVTGLQSVSIALDKVNLGVFASENNAIFSFSWQHPEEPFIFTGFYIQINDATGLSGGIIALIAILSVLFVGSIVAAILVFVFGRKYFRKKFQKKSEERNEELSNQLKAISEKFKNAQKIEDVTIGKMLGAGNFGEVYRGKAFNNTTEVALKKLKPEILDECLEEAKLSKKITSPYCVLFMGFYLAESEEQYMVFEFMGKGDLLGLLKKEGEKFALHQLYRMLLDVATGMAAVEAIRMVHRDLAARNLLVDNNYVVKVADFGLSIVLENGENAKVIDGKFPIRWSPPEVLRDRRFSIKSDVWSFGITAYEVLTRGQRSPYEGMNNQQVVNALLNDQYRMPQPKTINDDIWGVITKCWVEDPDKRPSFKELLDEIEEIWEKERSNDFEANAYKKHEVPMQEITTKTTSPPQSKIRVYDEGKSEIQPYGDGLADPSKSRSGTLNETNTKAEVKIEVVTDNHYGTSPVVNNNNN